jgi:glycosyltransferase involved in cell wall biosynthesis
MNKVGILTTFADLSPSYSLVTVVTQQLKMLKKYGFDPVLFTLPNFSDQDKVPEGVELRAVVPQWILEPYGSTGSPVPADFEENVKKTAEVYEKEFADLDCLITHDICFINSYLIYNVALKQAALEKLPMLHQIHSAPSNRENLPYPWSELWGLPWPDNSKLIYMNYTEQVAAAEMYGLWPKSVKVVFNPMDLREMFHFSDLTRELIDAYDLFSADVICVYPVSSTRMDDNGKAVRKVIAVMGFMKQLGQKVRLIIPNAHANAQAEKDTIAKYLEMGRNYELDGTELIFTSLFKPPANELGVPHQTVVELFQLANLFIFPSYSENAPLILLEAAATKNLLVLNEDFAPMKDFVKAEGAYYFRFKSRLLNETTYRNGEDTFYNDIAKILISELENNKINRAFTTIRQKFNIDWIATHQFIPAIKEIINNVRGI